MVRSVAEKINIPFTVGGGISSVEDVDILLNNGADKVSINSSAVKNPQLINDLAQKFDVTLQTIRRDLSELADMGHLDRVHGGAVARMGVTNIAWESRRRMNEADAKKEESDTKRAKTGPENGAGITESNVATAVQAEQPAGSFLPLAAMFTVIPALCLALWCVLGLLMAPYLDRSWVRNWLDRLMGVLLFVSALMLVLVPVDVPHS